MQNISAPKVDRAPTSMCSSVADRVHVNISGCWGQSPETFTWSLPLDPAWGLAPLNHLCPPYLQTLAIYATIQRPHLSFSPNSDHSISIIHLLSICYSLFHFFTAILTIGIGAQSTLEWGGWGVGQRHFAQGRATGGISGIYTLPKSVQVNLLWGRNDARTVIEREY